MRTLGKLTTLVGVAVTAVAVVVGIRSVPDIKRYLKMRQM
jgi:hypothetical protein